MRAGLFILFRISLFWCAQGVAEPAVLTGETEQLPIDEYAAFLEDPEGKLPLEQFVSKDKKLQSNQT